MLFASLAIYAIYLAHLFNKQLPGLNRVLTCPAYQESSPSIFAVRVRASLMQPAPLGARPSIGTEARPRAGWRGGGTCEY